MQFIRIRTRLLLMISLCRGMLRLCKDDAMRTEIRKIGALVQRHAAIFNQQARKPHIPFAILFSVRGEFQGMFCAMLGVASCRWCLQHYQKRLCALYEEESRYFDQVAPKAPAAILLKKSLEEVQ